MLKIYWKELCLKMSDSKYCLLYTLPSTNRATVRQLMMERYCLASIFTCCSYLIFRETVFYKCPYWERDNKNTKLK